MSLRRHASLQLVEGGGVMRASDNAAEAWPEVNVANRRVLRRWVRNNAAWGAGLMTTHLRPGPVTSSTKFAPMMMRPFARRILFCNASSPAPLFNSSKSKTTPRAPA